MESKHEKNISNFEKMTLILEELGASYNPSRKCLLPAALHDKLEEARAVFDEAAAAQAACRRVLYDRETGILKLVKLIKTQLAREPGRTSVAYQQINALEFRK